MQYSLLYTTTRKWQAIFIALNGGTAPNSKGTYSTNAGPQQQPHSRYQQCQHPNQAEQREATSATPRQIPGINVGWCFTFIQTISRLPVDRYSHPLNARTVLWYTRCCYTSCIHHSRIVVTGRRDLVGHTYVWILGVGRRYSPQPIHASSAISTTSRRS